MHSSSSQSECVSPYREGVINRTIIGPAPAQEWEQWLRSRLIFVVRDRAEFLAVFTLSTGSLALSFYRMFTSSLASNSLRPSRRIGSRCCNLMDDRPGITRVLDATGL